MTKYLIMMDILPELLNIIKEYTIGYKIIEEDRKYIKEVWRGDQRFKTGIYKLWYLDGRISCEFSYKYGRRHGISKYYTYISNMVEIHKKKYYESKLIYEIDTYMTNCSENSHEYYTRIASLNQGVHDRVQNN